MQTEGSKQFTGYAKKLYKEEEYLEKTGKKMKRQVGLVCFWGMLGGREGGVGCVCEERIVAFTFHLSPFTFHLRAYHSKVCATQHPGRDD